MQTLPSLKKFLISNNSRDEKLQTMVSENKGSILRIDELDYKNQQENPFEL